MVRGNLKDFVIDCHIIPVMPSTSATEHIQIGGYTINNLAHPVTSDYVTIECGTIKVDSCYDGFEDYQTEYKLYLPFIGFVDLNPNYVANNYLTLKYRFNVIDGSCIAFLSSSIIPNSSDTSIVGVYNGSCCVHMPLTGADYSTIVSGMLRTAGNIATSVSTKNPLPAIDAASVQEVQPYCSMWDAIYDCLFFCINEDIYNDLTPEQQAVVDECGQKAVEYERYINRSSDTEIKERWESKNGVTFTEKSDMDIDSFKEAVDGVDEWFVNELKTQGYEDAQDLVDLFTK